MEKYYEKDNQVIYNCDNLELLKSLDNECIDLIYCDILYNTGKVFDDYNDNLGTPKDAVEWYRPRLIEMKRVLKNNGSIFYVKDFYIVNNSKCITKIVCPINKRLIFRHIIS